MLRLRESGILHHELGTLIDNIRVGLVGGKDPHLGPGLPVRDQVVEAQAGCKLALAILLGDLLIEEAPVPAPAPVLILGLDTVKLADSLLFPAGQLKGLARPLVLPEYQHGEEGTDHVHLVRTVPQHSAVVRLHYGHPAPKL